MAVYPALFFLLLLRGSSILYKPYHPRHGPADDLVLSKSGDVEPFLDPNETDVVIKTDKITNNSGSD